MTAMRIITNFLEKVTNSGIIHLGVSDRSVVFLTRKTQYYRNGPRVIETRQFKHFNRGNSYVISINYHGPMLTCIQIQMICVVIGKKCFLVASMNTHHSN